MQVTIVVFIWKQQSVFFFTCAVIRQNWYCTYWFSTENHKVTLFICIIFLIMFVFYSFCLFQYNDLCFWYLRFERHVNTVKFIAGTTDKNAKRVNYIDHIHTIQNTDIHTSALAPYSSSVRLLQLETYPKKERKICTSNPSSKSDIIWDSLGRFKKHKVHFRSSPYLEFVYVHL